MEYRCKFDRVFVIIAYCQTCRGSKVRVLTGLLCTRTIVSRRRFLTLSYLSRLFCLLALEAVLRLPLYCDLLSLAISTVRKVPYMLQCHPRGSHLPFLRLRFTSYNLCSTRGIDCSPWTTAQNTCSAGQSQPSERAKRMGKHRRVRVLVDISCGTKRETLWREAKFLWHEAKTLWHEAINCGTKQEASKEHCVISK